MTVGVHETAVVDDGATIGEGTRIWHFSHVMSGAKIGSNCVLGQNVHVSGKATIGYGCKIQNNVSLYDEVHIGDEVFLGPSCVFTNVKTPRAFVNRKGKYEPTIVKRGASIGANATIVCGVVIGEYALVGAGSVVTRHIAPYALVMGIPAVQVGWVCICGKRLWERLDLVNTCAECGCEYFIMDEKTVGGGRIVPKARTT